MGKSTVSLCVALQKDKRFQQFVWRFSPIWPHKEALSPLARNLLVNIGPVQTTGATVKIPCAAACPLCLSPRLAARSNDEYQIRLNNWNLPKVRTTHNRLYFIDKIKCVQII